MITTGVIEQENEILSLNKNHKWFNLKQVELENL